MARKLYRFTSESAETGARGAKGMVMDNIQSELTHVDAGGHAHMVDVSDKAVTVRVARATASVHMRPETLRRVQSNEFAKGDVLAVARVAGIQGAKRTSDLIPLCHPLPLTGIDVRFELLGDNACIRIIGEAKTEGRTGVEMEALTAVSTAALTIYDMCKAVDRGMTIDGVRLLFKSGGRSGDYIAE